ncbi:hypothetical protein Ait01nite_051460 [Actinoplanes italicus]|nr:hypothetical protein Ait01nite_051460 [Actinoplanes italicus]
MLLRAALRELPPRQRPAVALFYLYDLPVAGSALNTDTDGMPMPVRGREKVPAAVAGPAVVVTRSWSPTSTAAISSARWIRELWKTSFRAAHRRLAGWRQP